MTSRLEALRLDKDKKKRERLKFYAERGNDRAAEEVKKLDEKIAKKEEEKELPEVKKATKKKVKKDESDSKKII